MVVHVVPARLNPGIPPKTIESTTMLNSLAGAFSDLRTSHTVHVIVHHECTYPNLEREFISRDRFGSVHMKFSTQPMKMTLVERTVASNVCRKLPTKQMRFEQISRSRSAIRSRQDKTPD